MKQIYFIKTFPYNPTFGGRYSKYKGYRLICNQTRSPRLSKLLKVKLANLSSPIICSEAQRSIETAKAIKNSLGINKITKSNKINEIRFDLSNLLTEKEYETFGSNLVRERFVEAFNKDDLLETRKNIKLRIDHFISDLEKLPDGKYLVTSHSFFLKILQIYLSNPKLFSKPKVLWQKFNTNKKTYGFGKGFSYQIK